MSGLDQSTNLRGCISLVLSMLRLGRVARKLTRTIDELPTLAQGWRRFRAQAASRRFVIISGEGFMPDRR